MLLLTRARQVQQDASDHHIYTIDVLEKARQSIRAEFNSFKGYNEETPTVAECADTIDVPVVEQIIQESSKVTPRKRVHVILSDKKLKEIHDKYWRPALDNSKILKPKRVGIIIDPNAEIVLSIRRKATRRIDSRLNPVSLKKCTQICNPDSKISRGEYTVESQNCLKNLKDTRNGESEEDRESDTHIDYKGRVEYSPTDPNSASQMLKSPQYARTDRLKVGSSLNAAQAGSISASVDIVNCRNKFYIDIPDMANGEVRKLFKVYNYGEPWISLYDYLTAHHIGVWQEINGETISYHLRHVS